MSDSSSKLHLLDSILRNPNLSNLVDIYDPVKLVGRVLREPTSILEGRRGIRHHHLSPDFDLRETSDAYFLEGEFPGVSGRSAIKLQWLDGHTLRVEANIWKINLRDEWGSMAGDIYEQEEDDEVNTNQHATNQYATGNEVPIDHAARKGGDAAKHDNVLIWLNERREGLYTRSFHFPAAVDTDGTKARLVQGLLRIRVPKVHKTQLSPKSVDIDQPEHF
jgi:HSP20 family molecular chaperone IbpA